MPFVFGVLVGLVIAKPEWIGPFAHAARDMAASQAKLNNLREQG